MLNQPNPDKHELLPDTLSDFQEHFGSCHDALIWSIEESLLREYTTQRRSPYVMRITLAAQDWLRDVEHQWVNLIIELENVSELNLQKGANYDFAVISKMEIRFLEDQIVLSFFGEGELPSQPGQVESKTGADGKICTIAAKRCFWYIDTYHEPLIEEWFSK